MTARSQDLPELFCPTGAIWWVKTVALRQTKTFHTPNRTGWKIPWQRGIDIDTFEDWGMAEVLFRLEQKVPGDSGPARAVQDLAGSDPLSGAPIGSN